MILLLAALLLRGRFRFIYSLLLPVAAFAWVLALPHGEFAQFELLGQTLTAMRVDRLSLLFSYIFLIASLLGVIYALAEHDIKTRDDLAELAVDELTEMTGIDDERAKEIILKARAHWFE